MNMNTQRFVCRRKSQSGAAALEFALILPLLILLLYGLAGFGSVFYTQMTVSRAAADGARALSLAGSVSSYGGVTEDVKTAIRLEVINSLALSIIAPLGLGDYTARQNWLQQNVMSQISVDNGSCGGDSASGVLRVRVQYPFSSVRMLPPITLPMVGSLDGWMPESLTGCAIAQL
jgi:Flp pilus assembly protein TadG